MSMTDKLETFACLQLNDGCTEIDHIVSIGLLTSIGRLDNLSNKCTSAHNLVGKSK